jgi:CheY-like chemotaxis protein
MDDPKRSSTGQPYTVLLVEDSEEDARLFERALGQMQGFHLIARMETGQEAIGYLKGEGKFANRSRFPVPQIVMLDVDIADGLAALEWAHGRKPRPIIAAFSNRDGQATRKRVEELRADLYEPKIRDAEIERFIHFASNVVAARRREGAL